MTYDNTNKGVLFKADKRGNETWADYSGTINIDGSEYYLSAWVKKPKDSSKPAYMSLSVKVKSLKPVAKPPVQEPDNLHFEDDADLPF